MSLNLKNFRKSHNLVHLWGLLKLSREARLIIPLLGNLDLFLHQLRLAFHLHLYKHLGFYFIVEQIGCIMIVTYIIDLHRMDFDRY